MAWFLDHAYSIFFQELTRNFIFGYHRITSFWMTIHQSTVVYTFQDISLTFIVNNQKRVDEQKRKSKAAIICASGHNFETSIPKVRLHQLIALLKLIWYKIYVRASWSHEGNNCVWSGTETPCRPSLSSCCCSNQPSFVIFITLLLLCIISLLVVDSSPFYPISITMVATVSR